ncbi:hypothetical protein MNBD_PLANCTO02-2078 [hydrothermal vent metagenome]|uniref:Uncharacterized protein n=1 Tax=hydrothermal vent metagenome TaxID=652676 RepID=A0A3B1E4N8_9ZZZZ
MARVWVDWNSYSGPTISYERTDHLPYHPPRVDYFRWMYGLGPGEVPARIIHAPAPVQNVSSPSTQSDLPSGLIQPAPSAEEIEHPKQFPVPPPPESNLEPKANGFNLIGYAGRKKTPQKKRTYSPLPRQSWMFRGK